MHRISDVDESSKTGVCSICGPVDIYWNGVRVYRCAKKQRADGNVKYSDPQVRERQRNARFLRIYGITLDEYQRLYAEQGGVCARCGGGAGSKLRLAVDHCHQTGRVRGLLCGPCNTYLGRLLANLHLLESDLKYLEAETIAHRLSQLG